MNRAALLFCLVVGARSGLLAGQAAPSGAPTGRPTFGRMAVHYGKWASAAAAVTFTALAAHEHSNSSREWDQLLAFCRADNTDCALGPNGRYVNAAAEDLYQASLAFDRRARARLVAGQVSLLVTAGLFLADLRRHASGPENIPLHPLQIWVDRAGGAARVGVRLAF